MHGTILPLLRHKPPRGILGRIQQKLSSLADELHLVWSIARHLRENPEYRGVLSDKALLEEKLRGNVVIEPFKRDHLATSSYDVSLGSHYYKEQDPKIARRVYNPFDPVEVARIWGEPEKAQPILDALPDPGDRKNIPEDSHVILLGPGETILAHTDEFIGGRNIITTMMKARSSLGRCFIEVCKCAGWGDVGYTNRWTMEITNNSRYYTIPLVVGMRLAQIVFFYTGAILEKDYTKGLHTKYQTESDLAKLQAGWEPSKMLPKLYKDFEKSK